MKKLIFASFSLAFILLFFACSKQELAESQSAISKSTEIPSFKDMKEFQEAYHWAIKSSPMELMSMNDKKGYKSVHYNYQMAIDEFALLDDMEAYQNAKKKFGDKAKFDDKTHSIKPLVNLGAIGWLVNADGFMKIGKSVIIFTDTKSITVKDGDVSVLPASVSLNSLLEGDFGSYFVKNRSKELELRGGCPFSLSSSAGPVSINGKQYRIKNSGISIVDESFITNDNLGVNYHVLFSGYVFGHFQRKTLFGWTVCERTNWNYSGGFDMEYAFNGQVVPFSGGNSGLTDSECDFQVMIPILGHFFAGSNAYYNSYLNDVHSISFDVGTSNGVSAGDSCN